MIHKTERLALKMLQRDKEALRCLAARQGETMAVVARRLIRRELKRRGLLREGDGFGMEVQDD
jgi:hypothetical protein